jgi:hypothetical protein
MRKSHFSQGTREMGHPARRTGKRARPHMNQGSREGA